MGMNPDDQPAERSADRLSNLKNFIRQTAPIGFAQHKGIRPRIGGGLQNFQRIFGVVFEAVKKMFRIKEDLAAMFLQISDGIGTQPEIFLKRAAKNLLDV